MLPKVKLSNIDHNNASQLAIGFAYNSQIKSKLQEIPSIKWSYTKKVWYLKPTIAHIDLIKLKLAPIATIDTTALPYTIDQKDVLAKPKRILESSQRDLLNNFFVYLKGKRYSKSTIRTYTNYAADFIAFHGQKPLQELNNRDVELFIESIFIKQRYSISSQRQFISAMKLFIVFETTTEIRELELVRPYKSRRLPVVLSQQEIIDIISNTKNLKHRALLAITYSCGLRISEVLNLRVADIDINRMQIFIKDGKGRKDRYVGLAKSFLPLLSNYFVAYKPTFYFIEGKDHTSYSATSVRCFLKKSCFEAGIIKKVTPHTLRHSYATHLLENGVNLRYIQTLLGHSRPETTMIYTQVMQTNLLAIENPLDVAVRKMRENDKEKEKVVLSRKF